MESILNTKNPAIWLARRVCRCTLDKRWPNDVSYITAEYDLCRAWCRDDFMSRSRHIWFERMIYLQRVAHTSEAGESARMALHRARFRLMHHYSLFFVFGTSFNIITIFKWVKCIFAKSAGDKCGIGEWLLLSLWSGRPRRTWARWCSHCFQYFVRRRGKAGFDLRFTHSLEVLGVRVPSRNHVRLWKAVNNNLVLTKSWSSTAPFIEPSGKSITRYHLRHVLIAG